MNDPEGGFPVYILDDDTILYSIKDLNHTEYWKQTVSKIVSQKYRVPQKSIEELPYSQKRARVVGSIFYCGEKISKKLFSKIEKILTRKLKYVYDEHETRSEYDVVHLKAHINNNITTTTI